MQFALSNLHRVLSGVQLSASSDLAQVEERLCSGTSLPLPAEATFCATDAWGIASLPMGAPHLDLDDSHLEALLHDFPGTAC